MMDKNDLAKWIQANGTGHTENKHFNGIDYLFATMLDGWIAVFEYDDGMYVPKTQAKDTAHAESFCTMRERVRVPFTVI